MREEKMVRQQRRKDLRRRETAEQQCFQEYGCGTPYPGLYMGLPVAD